MRVIEANERWHKQGHQNNFVNMSQSFRQLADGNTDWPLITDAVQAPNGYHLVPLTSHLELQEEGKLLTHCVGGYGWQCITGKSHIISIQDRKGVHISTLQINDNIPQSGDIRFEKGLIVSVQHHAVRNSNPPKECLEAAAWYIEQLCARKIAIHVDEMRKYRAEIEKAKARNLISQKLGYHPEQTDKAEELYGICRDYLPPDWPKPTLDGMMKALRITQQIMDHIEKIPVTLKPSDPQQPTPDVQSNVLRL